MASMATTVDFDVFVSYNSDDRDLVVRVAEELRRQGLEPWLDRWHLTPGGRWQKELADGLRASRTCAVMVGPSGMGDWSRQELSVALDLAAKDPDFRVFPVLLPGVGDPFEASVLPPFLSSHTWVDLREGWKGRERIDVLLRAIRGLAFGAPSEEIDLRDDAPAPYVGLRPFEEADAPFYVGREADVQRLLERLRHERLVAVVGPSGNGKSSLLRAGLLPAIRAGALPDSDTWHVEVLRPAEAPLTNLAVALTQRFPRRALHTSLERLESDDRALHLACVESMAKAPEAERTVFFVDQFEELFTLCDDQAERERFVANLLHAAGAPGGRCVVILGMRADFYPHCAQLPPLARVIEEQQFLVADLPDEALRRVVVDPARRAGLALEPGLAETILEDVGEEPGALPLLQHALREVWERRRGDLLTLEDYRSAGGVTGALAQRADEVFEGLEPAQQDAARRLFLRLTQPGEGTSDTRRRVRWSEVAHDRAADDLEAVVAAFTSARLVTTTFDDAAGTRWVDVSHEALIRSWPRLRTWVDADREGLRLHRRITVAAGEWDKAGRDPDLLWRGSRLAMAAEYAGRDPEALDSLEAAFVEASRTTEEERAAARKRATRRLISSLAAGLILLTFASLAALSQRNTAVAAQDDAEAARVEAVTARDEASSRELAATAQSLLAEDPAAAMAVALEAWDRAPTPEAAAAVRAATIGNPILWSNDPGEIGPLAPQGAVSGEDGTFYLLRYAKESRVERVDLSTGEVLASLDFTGTAFAVRVAGDDLLVGTQTGEVLVLDRQTLEQQATIEGWQAFASGDGQWIVAQDDLSIRVLDRDTLEVVTEHVAANNRETIQIPCNSVFCRRPMHPTGAWAVTEDLTTHTANLVALPSLDPVASFAIAPDRTLLARRASFRTDGAFAAANLGDAVGVFDTTTGRALRRIAPEAPVHDVAWFGDSLVVSSGDGVVEAYDPDTAAVVATFAGVSGPVDVETDGEILVGSGEDGAVAWDRSGAPVTELPAFSGAWQLLVDRGTVVAVAVTGLTAFDLGDPASAVQGPGGLPLGQLHDGTVVLNRSQGQFAEAVVMDLETGEQLAAAEVRRNPFYLPTSSTAAITADRRRVVLGAGEGNVVLADDRLREIASVSLDDPAPDQADPTCTPCVVGIGTGPDGTTHVGFASSASVVLDGDLEVLGTTTPHPTTFSAGSVFQQVLGDGEALRFAADPEAPWALERLGQPTVPLDYGHKHLVIATALAPARDLVATGTLNGEVILRRAPDFGPEHLLPHPGRIQTLQFLPDDRLLVGSSEVARLWDLATVQPIAEFRGHAGEMIGALGLDDGRIATFGYDGTVKLFTCEACRPIEEIVEIARQRLPRELTVLERRLYLGEAA